MTERMGANGMPMKSKVIDEIAKNESTQMIQEILEENPNVLSDVCEVCGESPCVCDDVEE